MQQPITVDSPEVFSSEKETYYFDRKSARKDTAEIAKHISAFANAAGGKLVIGIEDDGTVSGFKRDGARAIEDFKRAAITDCVPSPAVTSKELPVVNTDGEDEVGPRAGSSFRVRQEPAQLRRRGLHSFFVG